ncbi:MAG: hypothetical protein K6E33_08180, partial [Lachnospiraceae bacterium]|nr:hypothetical protein [Lachnospiraceae bacterium]
MPPEKTEPAETGPISFDIEPDLTYEIPEETPHIAVDNTGYLIGQEKIAILENCKAGDPFYVVKADTGESVYSGLLEASQTGMVHADFTDLDEAGRYYVWSEDIGASFPFETGEDVYKDLRKEGFRNVKIDSGNTDAACRDLLMYLIADEAGFAAADEEEGKALLETGMKCAEKWLDLNEGTPAMCAALAGMSVASVKTDAAFSGRCLSAARRMENAYLAAHPEDAAGIFLMSASLYRADGSLFDKGRAESFLAAAPEPDLTDENIFYGCAFYLFTRRKVDTLVYERLMKQMTEESSSIAQNDRRSPY